MVLNLSCSSRHSLGLAQRLLSHQHPASTAPISWLSWQWSVNLVPVAAVLSLMAFTALLQQALITKSRVQQNSMKGQVLQWEGRHAH
jgi:hypothetical protein